MVLETDAGVTGRVPKCWRRDYRGRGTGESEWLWRKEKRVKEGIIRERGRGESVIIARTRQDEKTKRNKRATEYPQPGDKTKEGKQSQNFPLPTLSSPRSTLTKLSPG